MATFIMFSCLFIAAILLILNYRDANVCAPQLVEVKEEELLSIWRENKMEKK